MTPAENPLLTPFELPPFSKIEASHFLPAIETAIANTKKNVDAIVANNATPTFSNIIEPMEFADLQLNRIGFVFSNMHSANATDEIQALASVIFAKLSSLHNDIMLNTALFEKIKAVYDKRNEMGLTKEQQQVLDNHYKNFVLNGALLTDSQKSELRSLDERLSKLSIEFGKKILNDTHAFQLHITDEKDMEGLPDGQVAAAKDAAAKRHLEGWLFTLDFPSYVPFLTYAKNRVLRKKMFYAYSSKGFQSNENNTESTLLTMAKLKLKKANLLGFSSYAEYKLQNRMAKEVSTVQHFLDDLLKKSHHTATQELEEMKKYAKEKDGITDFNRWDNSYYAELLRQQKFHYNEEALRPYFKLENVLNGVFEIAGELYDLSFSYLSDAEVYHPDVKVYRVTNKTSGELVGHLFTDFFPRTTKRSGAWMSNYKDQYKLDGKNERPIVAITCNFTMPTSGMPSLLSHGEVCTLFHEFGHALHGMLSDVSYPSISGTHVYWDFVELPSQLMENWCYEREALVKFARHYQTGELLPDSEIEKIDKAAAYHAGIIMLRQIGLGKLDLGWHAVSSLDQVADVRAYEANLIKETNLFTDDENVCISTSFSHIFQGGYSAGYYSYKWAEVLDADAFEYFKEKGIFNKEVADSFKKNILSAGGSAHPTELYIGFRGKEASVTPLLKRSNLQ